MLTNVNPFWVVPHISLFTIVSVQLSLEGLSRPLADKGSPFILRHLDDGDFLIRCGYLPSLREDCQPAAKLLKCSDH